MPYKTLDQAPPLPGDEDDVARRDHTRKRRRILTGHWQTDLIDHLAEHFDPIRRNVVGRPDMSTNVLKSVVQQLSALYTRPPTVHHEDGVESIEPLLVAVAEAGYWSVAQRLQQWVLGMRECLVRPTWQLDGGLMYRLVTPDVVYAESPADDPENPNRVVEARPRVFDGEDVWTWDEVDLRDPANPLFKVWLVDEGKKSRDLVDVTEHYLGAKFDGAAYPWRDDEGRPVMPYVLYHAARTGELWDSYEGRELVEGALTVAVLWTYWLHNVRDSAWAQKWTLDAYLRGTAKGGKRSDYSEHSAVTTDPSAVMQFKADGQGGASIGQWTPPVDPETLGRALQAFEERLGVHFDIGPADYQRDQAMSGYAIALKRESVREAQRRFESQFRVGDKRLLRVSAIMLNRGTEGSGVRVPTGGFALTYPSLPRTSAEIQDSLKEYEGLMAMGLVSKVDAYMDLHSGVGREEALKELMNIEQETRLLGAGAAALPQP